MCKMNKYLIPTTVVLLLSACSSYNEDNPLVPVPQKSYSSTTPNWNSAIQQYQWNSLIQWSQYGW